MRETEWLASTDPEAMLELLRGKVSGRKLRLFAVACCRQVWDGEVCQRCDGMRKAKSGGQRCDIFGVRELSPLTCHTCQGTGKVGGLTDPRSRRAVEVAERFADGDCSEAELLAGGSEGGNARRESGVTPFDPGHDQKADMLLLAAANCCQPPAYGAAIEVGRLIQNHVTYAAQAALLRDIAGNPFRPLPKCGWCLGDGRASHDEAYGNCTRCGGSGHALSLEILLWNDRTVRRIAEGIYAERAFDRMPILSDALLDAGCDDEDLIQHCRSAGTHVRGCWCIDLLIGKE